MVQMLLKRRRGSEWTPIYMLIVMIIAAIIVIKLIKPVFQQTSIAASESLEEAKTVSRSLAFILFTPGFLERAFKKRV
ncbi:MAG: hypothetical protein NTY90_02320 [Candidatus Micrarchaeota archaeon]|nr:hypothetical protein [Candidatus Micrarchaeota archaeon]